MTYIESLNKLREAAAMIEGAADLYGSRELLERTVNELLPTEGIACLHLLATHAQPGKEDRIAQAVLVKLSRMTAQQYDDEIRRMTPFVEPGKIEILRKLKVQLHGTPPAMTPAEHARHLIKVGGMALELRKEEGGPRHYLMNKPVHCGAQLEAMVHGPSDDKWRPLRYECDLAPDIAEPAPYGVLEGGKTIALTADVPLRWPPKK